jgi:hypothetical protein|tara:strand:- start:537 stop:1292 length:756 start_codon:yes stop_codon:yes gene_type:complete
MQQETEQASDTAVEVAQADGRDFVTQEDVEKVSETSDRPEWLPEKFNSPEDLAKSYNELSQKLGSKDEDIRNQIIEEIQAEAFSERPEKAGDYQLPEMVDEEMAVDNELLQWWSDHSFENGYSQEEFQKGIEMYAQAINGTEPDLEAESAKLGDSAEDRIQAASLWANNFFPEETIPAIERLCETSEGIVALEAIMEKMKDGSFGGDTQPTAGLSEAQLREMMSDSRYHGYNKDAEFVKQVDEGWKQLYRG